jgi:hypothetical protein
MSKKMGKNILTIHYRKRCILVEDIECNVPIKTCHRKTQPHCVLCGRGVVTIVDKKAFINKE